MSCSRNSLICPLWHHNHPCFHSLLSTLLLSGLWAPPSWNSSLPGSFHPHIWLLYVDKIYSLAWVRSLCSGNRNLTFSWTSSPGCPSGNSNFNAVKTEFLLPQRFAFSDHSLASCHDQTPAFLCRCLELSIRPSHTYLPTPSSLNHFYSHRCIVLFINSESLHMLRRPSWYT